MKYLILILATMLHPNHSFAKRFESKVELRNFIITHTPKTVEVFNGQEIEIYQIQGRRVGWSNLVGMGYILVNEVSTEFSTNTFIEFTADTNVAVRAVGVLCLAKLKYDFKILSGDTTPVYMTHGDCRGGEVVTLEYLSEELKNNHHCQFYFGVISGDEYSLQCATEAAKAYIAEQGLGHVLDTNQVVDAKTHHKMDVDKLHWDIYFLKKEGQGKPYMGLVRVYNRNKESELIPLK